MSGRLADGLAPDVSQMAERQSSARFACGLSDGERVRLETWARSRTSPARLVLRSRIVLLGARGLSKAAIAQRLGTTVNTVTLWCRRFEAGGPESLTKDASGRGRKRTIARELAESVRTGLNNGVGVRAIARRSGISPASVIRIRDREV
jgi:transposase-like protein